MNEYQIGYYAIGGLAGLVIGCFFYMLGGRANKWLRRFVGSAIIASTVIGLLLIFGLFQYIHLLIYPLLAIGFSLGYGGDNLVYKLIRRAVFMLGVLTPGLLLAWTLGGNAWFVFIFHAGLGLFSIYLGTTNKLQASAEEVFVCLVLNAGLIAYSFVV